MERAPLTVVAEVGATTRIDLHGRSAVLTVETPLTGDVREGASLRIAWEELAVSRDDRFRDGERVLVALEPLPGSSIWIQRFPDADVRARVLGVAAGGDAFLRDPPLGTVDRLEHYLAMNHQARAGDPGSAVLVDLAEQAPLPLAIAAVRRLEGRPGLDAMLGRRSVERLVRVLLRPDATPPLEDAVIDVVSGAPLPSARPVLTALVEGEARPPASVYAALAALDGGFSADRTTQLLDGAPARHREVAVRNATGKGAISLLERTSRSDPDASVRAAALERLAVLEGEDAVEPLARGLGDPDAPVRRAAMNRLAALGDPALPTLERVIDGNDPLAARTALASLSLMRSSAAQAALTEIADAHPDEGLRALAGVALGRPLGEAH
jgi:HEAT repeat protein